MVFSWNQSGSCTYIEPESETIVVCTEEKTNNFQQQAKTKMDAANASLHAVNAELLIVEKDRRDTTSKAEQYEQEVELLKRLINEEKIKTDEEIEEIISSFKKMERVIVDKLDKFDASIEMTAAQ